MNDGVYQTIKIAAKAVNGLLGMNQPGNRENTAKDMGFIKTLLVALCTLKKIISMDENAKIENGIRIFIKGEYFTFRWFLINNFLTKQNI